MDAYNSFKRKSEFYPDCGCEIVVHHNLFISFPKPLSFYTQKLHSSERVFQTGSRPLNSEAI